METRMTAASAQPLSTTEDPPAPTDDAAVGEGQDTPEESFEAIIIQLDPAAAELLLRKAGL